MEENERETNKNGKREEEEQIENTKEKDEKDKGEDKEEEKSEELEKKREKEKQLFRKDVFALQNCAVMGLEGEALFTGLFSFSFSFSFPFFFILVSFTFSYPSPRTYPNRGENFFLSSRPSSGREIIYKKPHRCGSS